jgi:ELWxxDGT repeat protein
MKTYANARGLLLHLRYQPLKQFSLGLLGLGLACLSSLSYALDDVSLVADINQQVVSPTLCSQPVLAGNTLYFCAERALDGQELWKYDAQTGYSQVIDLAKGVASSSPEKINSIGNTLYFVATDGASGKELWKTDGTAAGTQLVKDITGNGGDTVFANFTVMGSRLFFTVDDTTYGKELWVSDGTAAGTKMVKDLYAGLASSRPAYLTVFNNALYFSADNGQNGAELWKTDGTAAGTVLVKDIYAGSGNASPKNLFVWGSTLYFVADDGSTGPELWKSDGTSAGTSLLKDIGETLFGSYAEGFTVLGNQLFFTAYTYSNGWELWKTDGTAAGTVLVKDIEPGKTSSYPGNLTAFNNKLYFHASTAASGDELWVSDGTEAGTKQFKELEAGALSSGSSNLTVFNNHLYLWAMSADKWQLWRTNDAATDLVSVLDVADRYRQGLISLGTNLYFGVANDLGNLQLWQSQGEPNTSKLLGTGTADSNPTDLTLFNNNLYVSADDGINGRALWKLNPSANSGELLKSFKHSQYPQYPSFLTATSNYLYFHGYEDSTGIELWRTDGTSANTRITRDVVSAAGNSLFIDSPYLAEFGGNLYYTATNATNGRELWRSDGSSGGTAMLKDIVPGENDSTPSAYTRAGETLFFIATDETHGRELWKTDGTAFNTSLVKDILPGTASSELKELTSLGDMLYFFAKDSATGTFQLWQSNGFEADTKALQTLVNPQALTVVGNTLFWLDQVSNNQTKVWRYIPSLGKAQEVKTLTGNAAAPAASVNGQYYFRIVLTDSQNWQLWQTDGSIDKATQLYSFSYDAAAVTQFKAVGNTLYFNALDLNVDKLWQTDGTATGTRLVKAATDFINPQSLSNLNNDLYFVAVGNPKYGREIYKLTAPAAALTFKLNEDSTFVGQISTNISNPRYALSGADAALFSIDTAGNLQLINRADYEKPNDANGDNSYELQVQVCDAISNCVLQALKIALQDVVTEDLSLQVKALLQGAMRNDGKMGDELRVAGLIPRTQPYASLYQYAGIESLSAKQNAIEGDNAVVDWVLIELRDKTTPTKRLAAIAGLLTRNGTVLNAATGQASLYIKGVSAGDYYVSLRHRNHLGVMSKTPITLDTSSLGTLVDFSKASTATYGSDAQYIEAATAMLWAGDINADNRIFNVGVSNDLLELMSAIIDDPANGASDGNKNLNHILQGYTNSDITLDGYSIFAGPNNDILIPMLNVALHPKNQELMAANYIINGVVPK